MAIIAVEDLIPFADIEATKAVAMIDDAVAMAATVAPCILDDDFAHKDAAKAIIRGAILRWHEAGTGAYSQQSAGPFQVSVDTRQQRRGMFYPSELDQLRRLCQTSGGAFSIDTAPVGSVHAETCSIVFGAGYCSCGADIAGFPIYGSDG